MTDRASRASSRRGDSQPLVEPNFSKRQTSRSTTSMPKRVTRTRTQTGQGHDSADVDPERGVRKNTRRGLRQDSVESNERAKSRDGRRGTRKVTSQKGREGTLSTVDEINDTQAQPNSSIIPASTHSITGSQTKFNTSDGISWLKSKQAGKGARTRQSARANPLEMQDIRVDPIPRKLRPTVHDGPSTQVVSPRRTQRRSYVPSTAPPRVTNEMVPREDLDDEYQPRNRDDDESIAERSLTPEDVAERKARQDLSKNKENARQPGQRAQGKARKRFNETQEDRHKVGWDDEEELINDVPPTTSRRDLKRKRIVAQEDLQEDDDEADDGDGVYQDEERDEEDNDDEDDDEDEEDEESGDAFETNTRPANPSRRKQAPVSPRRAPLPPNQTQPETQGSPPKRTRPNPAVEAADNIDLESAEDDVDYPPMELISQQAREKVAAHRENKPQTRKPWTEAESRRLIEFIENDNYKCSWVKISKADQLLGNRGQVGLKDRARNIKFAYLKAGLALPLNFDLVTLKASEKKFLEEMDIEY